MASNLASRLSCCTVFAASRAILRSSMQSSCLRPEATLEPPPPWARFGLALTNQSSCASCTSCASCASWASSFFSTSETSSDAICPSHSGSSHSSFLVPFPSASFSSLSRDTVSSCSSFVSSPTTTTSVVLSSMFSRACSQSNAALAVAAARYRNTRHTTKSNDKMTTIMATVSAMKTTPTASPPLFSPPTAVSTPIFCAKGEYAVVVVGEATDAPVPPPLLSEPQKSAVASLPPAASSASLQVKRGGMRKPRSQVRLALAT
mmetsp:Transcript_48295/g.105468  ORF Transcript_48295/g.105468 Transcript_48295/m.105468 type:complete len:262 (-) Transcript_48295:199-984(-)